MAMGMGWSSSQERNRAGLQRVKSMFRAEFHDAFDVVPDDAITLCAMRELVVSIVERNTELPYDETEGCILDPAKHLDPADRPREYLAVAGFDADNAFASHAVFGRAEKMQSTGWIGISIKQLIGQSVQAAFRTAPLCESSEFQ
jgi:hypothetical protein